jgi:ADP-ribose pyrophosphatase YjhB (NUDIX family)
MDKFYQHNDTQRFHISVGAVVFNADYEVCVHHIQLEQVPESLRFLCDHLSDVWHLMRESLEDHETLAEAVHRGCKEEFGADVTIEKYLGAKIDTIIGPNQSPFEKLTIYHAVRLHALGDRTDVEGEGDTLMEWYSASEFLALLNTQCKKTNRPELDERIIIERFIEAYELN